MKKIPAYPPVNTDKGKQWRLQLNRPPGEEVLQAKDNKSVVSNSTPTATKLQSRQCQSRPHGILNVSTN